MPNLGIEIKRKCEICGNAFVIKTLDCIYCSPKCRKVASRRKKDKEKKEALFAAYAQTVPDIREYLAARQVVAIYGIERSTVECPFFTEQWSSFLKLGLASASIWVYSSCVITIMISHYKT